MDDDTKKIRSAPRSRWSELQTELLELIVKKLAPVDILRFEAVCSSWNQAAKSYISAPHFTLDVPQTPWLMIPSGEQNNVHTRRFFNLAENKFYTIKNVFGDFPHAWCVGSSHGWLLLMEKKGAARLLDPFSGHRIELPSFWTLPDHSSYKTMSRDYIIKAVTSSNPSSSSDFAVVIIYNTLTTRLAFYKHGDKAWTCFGQQRDAYYCDAIFHGTNGHHFFTLAANGSVEVWDLWKSFTVTYVIPSRHQVFTDDDLYGFKFAVKNYLVEWLGKLLLVRRFVANTAFIGEAIWGDSTPKRPQVVRPYRTLHFYIYRLRSTSQEDFEFEWQKVESLHDQALFLGGNHSMSSSSKDFPECEENSIYFTDDYWMEMTYEYYSDKNRVGGHDIGVYNFKDKLVKPLPYSSVFNNNWRIDPFPFWIVPNLVHGFPNGR